MNGTTDRRAGGDRPGPTQTYRDILIRKILAGIDLTGKSVLEIGAGTGGFVAYAASFPGATVLGIEPDDQAYALASETPLPENAEIRNLAMEDVGGRYDVVMMFDVLEHIKDDMEALRFIRSLLVPGGHFVMSVPGDSRIFGPRDVMFGHYRRYDRQEIDEKLRDAGFTVEEVLGFGPSLLSRINRMFSRARDAKESVSQDDRFLARRTRRSGYEKRRSALVRLLHPVYVKAPWVLSLQAPFLRAGFMNSHLLCVCTHQSDDGV